jgi:hypothetical protein
VQVLTHDQGYFKVLVRNDRMRSLEDPGVQNPSLDSGLSLWPMLTHRSCRDPVLGTQLRIRVMASGSEKHPSFCVSAYLLLSSTSTLRIVSCISRPQFPSDPYNGGLRIEILLDFAAGCYCYLTQDLR